MPAIAPKIFVIFEESMASWKRMRRVRMRIAVHWIPALVGIAIIAVESTATMSAANTSRWLLPIWEKLFGPVTPQQWAHIHHYIRKSGHFVGYGFLSLTFFEGWRVTIEGVWAEWKMRFRYAALLALLSTVTIASWDEWHQRLIPGRTSSPWDVLLDFCGALVAHLLLLAFLARRRRKRAGSPRAV